MGSKDVEVRKRQLERAELRVSARKTELETRGLDARAVAKDPVLRNLRAAVKKAKRRVEAPLAAAAHAEKVAAKIAKEGKKSPGEKRSRKAKVAAPSTSGKGGGKKGGGKTKKKKK